MRYRVKQGFYEQALAPLATTILMAFGRGGGFGIEGKPLFWVTEREPLGTGTHIAFQSADRASVDPCIGRDRGRRER